MSFSMGIQTTFARYSIGLEVGLLSKCSQVPVPYNCSNSQLENASPLRIGKLKPMLVGGSNGLSGLAKRNSPDSFHRNIYSLAVYGRFHSVSSSTASLPFN